MPGMEVEAALQFLRCRTPDAWFEQAPGHIPELLIDHANCEKKAAGTALSLLYRYVDKPHLLRSLSRLAREELRHFEQVLAHLARRRIDYVHIASGRYAAGLRQLVRNSEPERLIERDPDDADVRRRLEDVHALLSAGPREAGLEPTDGPTDAADLEPPAGPEPTMRTSCSFC